MFSSGIGLLHICVFILSFPSDVRPLLNENSDFCSKNTCTAAHSWNIQIHKKSRSAWECVTERLRACEGCPRGEWKQTAVSRTSLNIRGKYLGFWAIPNTSAESGNTKNPARGKDALYTADSGFRFRQFKDQWLTDNTWVWCTFEAGAKVLMLVLHMTKRWRENQMPSRVRVHLK